MERLTALLVLACALGANAQCRQDGEWRHNAYLQSSLSSGHVNSTVNFYRTKDVKDFYYDNTVWAMRATGEFLGVVDNVHAFIAHPGGDSASYKELCDKHCEVSKAFMPTLQDCQNSQRWCDSLKNGNQWFASPNVYCAKDCGRYTSDGDVITLNPGTGEHPEKDTADKKGFQFGAHEYTHAWQGGITAMNGVGWIGEGSAVFMECLMKVKVGIDVNGGGGKGWKACIGDIHSQAKQLYSYEAGKQINWLQQYGEDRAKGDKAMEAMGKPTDWPANNNWNPTRHVTYDLGAMAALFAVTKARAVDAKVNSGDWFHTFMMCVEPVDDAKNVSETMGWRKCINKFSGYKSTADFYKDFNVWVQQDFETIAKDLETDEQIKTAMAVKFQDRYTDKSKRPWIPLMDKKTCVNAFTGKPVEKHKGVGGGSGEGGSGEGGSGKTLDACVKSCTSEPKSCEEFEKFIGKDGCANSCLTFPDGVTGMKQLFAQQLKCTGDFDALATKYKPAGGGGGEKSPGGGDDDGSNSPQCLLGCAKIVEVTKKYEGKEAPPKEACPALQDTLEDSCMSNCSTKDKKFISDYRDAQCKAAGITVRETTKSGAAQKEAKVAAAEKKAAEKKAAAEEKKAAVAEKKKAAEEKRAKLLANVAKKDAKKAEILAKLMEKGKKAKKMTAKLEAADADAACAAFLKAAKMDADKVACSATKVASRRSLLADQYQTETLADPDTVDVSAAETALKSANVATTVAEEDPETALAAVPGVDKADLTTYSTAAKEVVQAETEAKAAEAEFTAAEKEVETEKAAPAPADSGASPVQRLALSLASALAAALLF